MRNPYKQIMLFLAIAGSMVLSNFTPVTNGKTAVPATITHEGTKYVHCSLVKGYPFKTGREKEIISGIAVEEMGSRSSFWIGLSIADKVLFTPNDQKLLYGRNLVGKNLKAQGYPGVGEVIVFDYLTKEDRIITFKRAFFVTEISGWNFVMGYPVNEGNDVPSGEPSYFWVQIK